MYKHEEFYQLPTSRVPSPEVPCSTGWWQSRARVPKRSFFVASGRAALDAPGAFEATGSEKRSCNKHGCSKWKHWIIHILTWNVFFLGGVVKFTQCKGSNQPNLILYMIRLSIVHFFELGKFIMNQVTPGVARLQFFPNLQVWHIPQQLVGYRSCHVYLGFWASGYRISGFQDSRCSHPGFAGTSPTTTDHRQEPSDHFKDGKSVNSLVEDLYCNRVKVDADFLVLDVVGAGLGWCKGGCGMLPCVAWT